MTIGTIAKQSGVSKDTIRLYTEKGLISGTLVQAGSRMYSDYAIATVARVVAIKEVQALGFTLGEIKLLLDEVAEDCALTPRQVALLEAKLEEIHAKQRQLQELASFVSRKIQDYRSIKNTL